MTRPGAWSSILLLGCVAAAACTPRAGAGGPPRRPRPPGLPRGIPTLEVTLMPADGVTGTQRVNFAVPLAPNQLRDESRVRVFSGRGGELPAARRGLARYPDGSLRSVQLQVELAVTPGQVLAVQLGEVRATPAPVLALADVPSTLVAPDGTLGPRVWALLPAAWLSASGVAGPQLPEARTSGGIRAGFERVCDYKRHGTAAFLRDAAARREVWLYDRGTVMYRGHARRGDLLTLEAAYRETAIYRSGITGTGDALRIGVPTAAQDLKYHYTQNLAIHYLLTGDDRFRESAEEVAERIPALWDHPRYAGGGEFWTERHAGFTLLAYVWAGIVTDDRGAQLGALADAAVDAFLDVQRRNPPGWTDEAARCFAHQAQAHGEDYGTWGCSPWMSAILADALDAYATERGGDRAAAARDAIVKLGRLLAREGRDATGRPLYWIGLGDAADVADEYDEHAAESAYVIAMAWHWSGRTDRALRRAVTELVSSFAIRGTSPHTRSFNWQCRSAVATPYYLQELRARPDTPAPGQVNPGRI